MIASPSRIALALVLWTTPLAAGCAAPLQSGGVEVRPNAEARLDLMCRYRSSDAQHVCADLADE